MPTENQKPISIGVYKIIYPDINSHDIIRFDFYFGTNLPTNHLNSELVQTLQVPSRLKHLFPKPSEIQQIGYIKYAATRDKLASSTYYYPLNYFTVERGFGLGSLLELLAVHNLKKMGIRYVKTTAEASKSRRGQVKKMGFGIEGAYKIDDWKKGVGKAIRTARHFR